MSDKLQYIKPLLLDPCIGSDDYQGEQMNVCDAGEDFKKGLRKLCEQYPRFKEAMERGKQVDIRLELNHDSNPGFVMIIDVYPYDTPDDWKTDKKMPV